MATVVLQTDAQPDGFVLVVLVRGRDQLVARLPPCFRVRESAGEDAARHAGAHFVFVSWVGEERRAAPEDVCGRGVCVAFCRVEEKIEYFCSRDVCVLGSHIGEDDPRGGLLASPCLGGVSEILLAQVGEAE